MTDQYTLHHFYGSTYSLMVRLSLALGHQAQPDVKLAIKEVDVNLFKGQNLDEDFLAINPTGTVPVLEGGKLPAPITNSFEIARYFSTFYPTLLPQEHLRETEAIVRQIQSNDCGSLTLSFSDAPQMEHAMVQGIESMIGNPETSESHRELLREKIKHTHKLVDGAFKPERVKEVESTNRKLFAQISTLMKKYGNEDSIWILGGKYGTILDAFVIIWVSRLLDVERQELIPEDVLDYAKGVRGTVLWKDFMDGRSTMTT